MNLQIESFNRFAFRKVLSVWALRSIIIILLQLFNRLMAIIFAYSNRKNNHYNCFVKP